MARRGHCGKRCVADGQRITGNNRHELEPDPILNWEKECRPRSLREEARPRQMVGVNVSINRVSKIDALFGSSIQVNLRRQGSIDDESLVLRPYEVGEAALTGPPKLDDPSGMIPGGKLCRVP